MLVPGTSQFNCGTWKGSGRNAPWFDSRSRARERDIASGRAPAAQATIDMIYDDVWVIEDDGSLLISGSNSFDTQSTTFRFTPNGSGGYDVAALSSRNLDLVFGEDLGLGDDDNAVRALSFTFPLFGSNFDEVNVGSNGGVAFGGMLNPSGFFDADDFWNAIPKLAPYFMDLDPSAGAGSPAVYFKTAGDSAVVSWVSINEYQSNHKNTFQLFLRSDGTFDFSLLSIGSIHEDDGAPIIMGISPGGTQPVFERIHFSADLPYSGDAMVGLYEEYFSLADPLVNETALGQAFFQRFPDEFFQYVFFTNFPQTQAGFANEMNISNEVTGIGLSMFDNSHLYGSNGVLESRCNMNRIGAWSSSNPEHRFLGTQSFLTIMGQESGHRWGAFVYFRDLADNPSNLILGRSDAHWSYFTDVDHSCLEGGDWIETTPGTFTCPGNVDKFNELDEYLFGLRTAQEVSDFYYINSTSNNTEAARSQAPPGTNASAFGTRINVTVQNVIAQEGLRTPLPDAEEKDLRQGFIFLLRGGTAPTQADLDKIATFRRAWEDYFEESCDGRLSCNTSITRRYPVGVVEGQVTDANSGLTIGEFTVTSAERSFDQHVPAGGRYTFRYMRADTLSTSESVTLMFQADNYHPKTVNTTATYGSTLPLDVELDPISTPVLFTGVNARAVDAAVLVSWDIFFDEALNGFVVYRADRGVIRRLSAMLGTGERQYRDVSALPGERYEYFVAAVKPDGSEVRSIGVSAGLSPPHTELHGNFPNPFNPETVISFTLREPSQATLTVYAPDGRRVTTLVDGALPAGNARVRWNGMDASGRPVASGIYIYRLTAGAFRESRKMLLLK